MNKRRFPWACLAFYGTFECSEILQFVSLQSNWISPTVLRTGHMSHLGGGGGGSRPRFTGRRSENTLSLLIHKWANWLEKHLKSKLADSDSVLQNLKCWLRLADIFFLATCSWNLSIIQTWSCNHWPNVHEGTVKMLSTWRTRKCLKVNDERTDVFIQPNLYKWWLLKMAKSAKLQWKESSFKKQQFFFNLYCAPAITN